MSRCPTCGAQVREYKHGLNLNLCKGLFSLERIGGRGMIRDLNLTKSQFNNFQKLQYWGFVEKGTEENGHTHEWVLTEKGRDFVHGRIAVSKYMITYRNKTVGEDGQKLFIIDCLGDHQVWWREQYLENSNVRRIR